MRNFVLAAAAGMAGCAANPPPVAVPEHGVSVYVCHGESLGRFVGQPATAALGAEMLRESGARRLRWVAKGMMVTMDFSPERLTVFLDAASRVERANCG